MTGTQTVYVHRQVLMEDSIKADQEPVGGGWVARGGRAVGMSRESRPRYLTRACVCGRRDSCRSAPSRIHTCTAPWTDRITTLHRAEGRTESSDAWRHSGIMGRQGHERPIEQPKAIRHPVHCRFSSCAGCLSHAGWLLPHPPLRLTAPRGGGCWLTGCAHHHASGGGRRIARTASRSAVLQVVVECRGRADAHYDPHGRAQAGAGLAALRRACRTRWDERPGSRWGEQHEPLLARWTQRA